MPSDRPIEMDVQRQEDRAVIRIAGSVTMDVAREFGDRLTDTAQQDIRLMVVDLAELDFLCSEGLGALVTAHTKCAHRGGRIRLASPSDQIRDLLELTNLNRLFEVFPSVEEAMKP